VETLTTPTKLQELQRALYRRAKENKRFRFHALYDKVYRKDVLGHAYGLVKANRGAPGPDGVTFEQIEESGSERLLEELHEALKTKQYKPGAVRRVYIPKAGGGERPLGIPNIRDRVVQMAAKLVVEPIFEADFEEDSYGFRPKRDAHQALEAIEEALHDGMNWVLDGDISAYFDTIPHDRLMKTVAERVVDGSMLRLIKSFLEAPIIDERGGGGSRRNRQGTPQGGVISPLLANIYLHLVDRNFRRKVECGALKGRLIRYADDLVVLTPREPVSERNWLESLLHRLGLALHPTKTRTVNAEKERFEFLGHSLRWTYARKSKGHRLYFDISDKSLRRIRDELRRRTKHTALSIEQVVANLNTYIRGARQYFRRVVAQRRNKLDYFVIERVARWWRRKHKQAWPAWWLVRDRALWTKYGLERWYHPRRHSEVAR
jgi:group II intron reverse transcriptase/maturase